MDDLCYICNEPLHDFMTTPILELPDGSCKQCCEICANKNFPNWDEDDN